MKIGETTQFKGKAYTVEAIHGACPEAVKQIGVVQQVTIKGKRGGVRLLQIFANGVKRTIDQKGRSECDLG